MLLLLENVKLLLQVIPLTTKSLPMQQPLMALNLDTTPFLANQPL